MTGKANPERQITYPLRFPASMQDRVAELSNQRLISMADWIREAVREKLERDEAGPQVLGVPGAVLTQVVETNARLLGHCPRCGRPLTRGGLCAGTEYEPGGCGWAEKENGDA